MWQAAVRHAEWQQSNRQVLGEPDARVTGQVDWRRTGARPQEQATRANASTEGR